jgi:hypothetical protein
MTAMTTIAVTTPKVARPRTATVAARRTKAAAAKTAVEAARSSCDQRCTIRRRGRESAPKKQHQTGAEAQQSSRPAAPPGDAARPRRPLHSPPRYREAFVDDFVSC